MQLNRHMLTKTSLALLLGLLPAVCGCSPAPPPPNPDAPQASLAPVQR